MYQAANVAFKVVVIFLVRSVKLEYQLFFGISLCNVAAFCLAFLIDIHWSIIWVFSIVLSIGIAATLAVLLAWTDKYIGIKGFIGVIFEVSGSVGEVAFSPLIGFLFEEVSYMSIMYLQAGCCAICFVILVMLQVLGMKFKAGLDRHERENDQLTKCLLSKE